MTSRDLQNLRPWPHNPPETPRSKACRANGWATEELIALGIHANDQEAVARIIADARTAILALEKFPGY